MIKKRWKVQQLLLIVVIVFLTIILILTLFFLAKKEKQESFSIEKIIEKDIYIKNNGKININKEDIKIFVNDKQVSFSGPQIILPGQTAIFRITIELPSSGKIKVSSLHHEEEIAIPIQPKEICNNNIDDDNDGKKDCEDTDCAADSVCLLPSTCQNDSDCGTNNWAGDAFCYDNDVYQDYKSFKCNSLGISSASCYFTVTSQLKTDCSYSCENGECFGSCTSGEQRNCQNQNGVCAGSKETCLNNNWKGCSYSAFRDYEVIESTCDGLDNDCDGVIDEEMDCRQPSVNFDIAVVGGTPSGIAAALSAARLGRSVALIEEIDWLGGTWGAGGVIPADGNQEYGYTGIFKEFIEEIKTTYSGIDWSKLKGCSPGFCWEPHVAKEVFEQMTQNPKITIYRKTKVKEVRKEGDKVTGLVVENENAQLININAKVTIDATDTGELAPLAGVDYRFGRESRSEFNERFAGVIYNANPNDPLSTGEGDNKVQAYALRVVIKNYSAEGRIPPRISKPFGYEENRPSYIKGAVLSCDVDTWKGWQALLPNNKADLNAALGTSMVGFNSTYSITNPLQKEEIMEKMRNYVLGFMYYVQNEKCPGWSWGLADDEFPTNDKMPIIVYVREARRIKGVYTMTERDIIDDNFNEKSDSIAIGHYNMDSWTIRYVSELGKYEGGLGETYFSGTPTETKRLAYEVPYRALVPQTVNGILFSSAISATHVAWSKVRMEPVRMLMGQAAGTAASIAIQNSIDVRNVNAGEIQTSLTNQGVKFKLSGYISPTCSYNCEKCSSTYKNCYVTFKSKDITCSDMCTETRIYSFNSTCIQGSTVVNDCCAVECNRCSANRNKCRAFFKSHRTDCGDICAGTVTYQYDSSCSCAEPSCSGAECAP